MKENKYDPKQKQGGLNQQNQQQGGLNKPQQGGWNQKQTDKTIPSQQQPRKPFDKNEKDRK